MATFARLVALVALGKAVFALNFLAILPLAKILGRPWPVRGIIVSPSLDGPSVSDLAGMPREIASCRSIPEPEPSPSFSFAVCPVPLAPCRCCDGGAVRQRRGAPGTVPGGRLSVSSLVSGTLGLVPDLGLGEVLSLLFCGT